MREGDRRRRIAERRIAKHHGASITVMEAVSGWSMAARLGQTDRSGKLALRLSRPP